MMPKHLGHTYEARPLRPGYRWMAFDMDDITPIGRGEAKTKGGAESAAKASIVTFREHAQGTR